MKRSHHSGMVVGVGTAVGAVILASMGLLAGCAPGTICNNPDYEEQCMTGGAGGAGTGGSAGSGMTTGGTGGTPSAMGGTTGGGAGGTGGIKPPPACTLWTTKEDVASKLVMPKCSDPMGCHAMTFQPFFKNPSEAVTAMLDKIPATYCKMDKLINKADPSNSVIVTKVRATAPMATCPSGGNGGLKMPFSMPALNAAEMDCLEWWAHEVSK
jgi:hypothetical protein